MRQKPHPFDSVRSFSECVLKLQANGHSPERARHICEVSFPVPESEKRAAGLMSGEMSLCDLDVELS